MLKVTVSGSFHRHMHEIDRVVQELTDAGVRVLSPADPRVVDEIAGFLFVASDRVRSIRMVQDRHLQAIDCSDFLWLVAPDGYVGQSAAMELGYATAIRVPIYASTLPSDLTLSRYVQHVPSFHAAIEIANRNAREQASSTDGFLIDPHASLAAASSTLERMERTLRGTPRQLDDHVAVEIYRARDQVHSILGRGSRGLIGSP